MSAVADNLSNPADAEGNPREAFTYIAFCVELIEDFEANENVHSVSGSTEQYFTVEDDRIFSNSNGTSRALVIIGTSDLNLNVLALTNIKLNGYQLSEGTAAAEVSATRDMYDVNAGDLMAETAGIYAGILKGSNN